jgi:predicted nucleic acid-binding protein
MRSRILDRMIAAQAISTGITLITMNGDDFRDIPGLNLEVWPSPSL